MRSPLDGLRAARALGWRTAWHYLRYQTALRSGWLRRQTPLKSWPEEVNGSAERQKPGGRFFFDLGGRPAAPSAPWAAEARRHALSEAQAVLNGRFRMFGVHQVELGFPPDWNAFPPLPGGGEGRVSAERHWTEYQIEKLPGDVKLLWELSRFSWTYALARAYLWSGDDRFAEGFWQLLESWRAANLPNRGPQWISAQEVAFRLLALSFARFALAPWLRRKPERLVTMMGTLAVHAARIPPTLSYALAQNNNHLLAEAVGLYTAGAVFPELVDARRWRKMGRTLLERGLTSQIYSDGGYVQHSTNYQRLALELGLWGVRLAERNGETLRAGSVGALRNCAQLLRALTEPAGGRTPNFGPNDGAHLLPLSTCDFQDHRPALQAASAVLGAPPGWSEGPWNEVLTWLGLDAPPARDLDEQRKTFPQAGLELLGSGKSRGVLRAAEFSGRPGHQDQLHLDLWHGDLNLARDAGTFLYSGDPPWDNRLADAAVHNGPIADGAEPMQRVTRFLWLDWSRARVIGRQRSGDGRLAVVTAEHDGYRRRGVQLRRIVIRAGERRWTVIDEAHGTGEHRVFVAWLLPDGDYEISQDGLVVHADGERVHLEVGADQTALYRKGVRIDGQPPPFERPQWGWHSSTYALRQPCLNWVVWSEGALPLRMRSDWAVGDAAPLKLDWRENQGESSTLAAVRFGPTTLEVQG